MVTFRTFALAGLALAAACATRSGIGAESSPTEVPACAVLGNAEGPPGYFEFQVDQPVKLRTRGDNVTAARGRALTQFIVDTAGRPDLSTYKVLQATGTDVITAAREIIEGSLYTPALKGGCRVNQVVQQPYVFQ